MKFKLSLAVVLLLTIFFVFNTAFAMTDQERQALILQIQEQIAQLTQQLNQMITEQGQQGPPDSWCHTFNTNLGFKSSGTAEVNNLHIALKMEGISYAPDTGNTYTDATASAVVEFQEKYAQEVLVPYGLTIGTGYVGPSTRAKLNQLYGCVPVLRCTENNWTYILSPTTCTSTGQQTKTWTKIGACEGGVNHPPTETVNCNHLTDVCTSFTYSNWSACTQSGIQTRTVISSLPPNCTGGSPITSQLCEVYNLLPCTENNWTYTLSPLACSSTGQQTKTWTKIGSCSGGVNHPPTETVSCIYQANRCTSFTYSNWSACTQSGIQTRTVISSLPPNCTGGNPITSRACNVANCNSDWQCTEWSACTYNSQTRTCVDANNCGTTSGKPSEYKTCDTTCSPNWQCSLWSACASNNQTRTCTDANNCFTDTNKPWETQYCSINICQESIPGVTNIFCVYGLSPYDTEEHIEMDKKQLDSLVASVSRHLPEESCGCSWYGINSNKHIKLSCPSPKAGCDFTKVPEELPRRTFETCTSFTEVDPVEWSSRIARGASLEQAYQSTIENMKIMMLEIFETQCLKKMIDEYYVGGDPGYPSWMCPGEKYRLNPNSTAADWQKWVNGLWVSNFVNDCPTVAPTCHSSSVGCEDSIGKYWHSCYTDSWQKKYVCENDKCVEKDYRCIGGGCLGTSCKSGDSYEAVCTDSDGGQNFLNKGQCQDNASNKLVPTSYDDKCQDENTIYEKYCGNHAVWGPSVCLTKTYNCPWGCKDGACLPQSCEPDWKCTPWGACINGQQTRTCTDANNCGIPKPVPLGITQGKTNIGSVTETRFCNNFCTPNWQCGSWSTCTYNGNNGQQTRTCTDSNNCGEVQRTETQTCTVVCSPDWQCTDWGACLNNQRTRACADANKCGTIKDKPVEWQTCDSLSATVDIKVNGEDGPVVNVGKNNPVRLLINSLDALRRCFKV